MSVAFRPGGASGPERPDATPETGETGEVSRQAEAPSRLAPAPQSAATTSGAGAAPARPADGSAAWARHATGGGVGGVLHSWPADPAAGASRTTGTQAAPSTVRPAPTATAPDPGKVLAAGGRAAIDRNTQAHRNAIDRTGIGTLYGSKSSYASMSAAERKAWIQENAKAGTRPPSPKISHCIGWAMQNVKGAYVAAGKLERWNEIERVMRSKDFKGTELAKELQKDGWEGVYWNPDAKRPNDGNAEHTSTARQVARGMPYYGIKVQHTVTNYRPTDAGRGEKKTEQDLSGIRSLEKVPFFFGLAKGGMHTFVGREGNVSEVHWNNAPNDKDLIEEQPLTKFGWNSGVLMIPPGTWPASSPAPRTP